MFHELLAAWGTRNLKCRAASTLLFSFGLISLLSFGNCTEAASAKAKPRKPILAVHSVAPARQVGALPAPPAEREQSLIYRSALQPIGGHNAVALWLMGDSLPGSISIYLLASGGDSSAPPEVRGSGQDTEPLWPAWISKPVSTDFSGWHRILIPSTDFSYRAPSGSTDDSAPASLKAVDTIGIASGNTDGVLYVDDIVWANLDSAGNPVGDSTVIDSFADGNLASWRVKGSPEAVSRLTPGITALSQFVKDDHVSLKLDYSGLDANRTIEAQSIVRSMSVTGKDYVVSVPRSPFARILPGSLPLPSEISSRVSLTECPEQTECSSFAVYALHGLTNVSVHLASDLLGIGKAIPRSNVSVSVVKVWDRAGTSVLIDPDSSGPTPELLVKDDRVLLASTAGVDPDIRTSGDPVTDIPAGSEKQFWVDVTVPRNTPAGHYTCQLVVSTHEEPPFSLTLETNVLPLRLLSPSKQYEINFRGKLGDSDPGELTTDHVTDAQLSAQLADIYAHGLHYVTLSDAPDQLPEELTDEEAFNFQTPILYPLESGANGVATASAVNKLSSSSINYCYIVPDSTSLAADLAGLKQQGLQTAAVIDSDADYASVENNLDVAIYPVHEAYIQRLLKSGGKRESMTRDWLTWPSAQADPQANRLYSGFLLWRTNLYGAYISDYETCYSANAYDDSTPPTDSAHAAERPAMLTYPTQGGVIDTIQWESIREGITDVRYLTTFYSALRECKDAKVDLVQVAKAEADVRNFLASDFWLMSDADYEKGRTMIMNFALQLRMAVDNYNAHPQGAVNQSSTGLRTKGRTG